MIGRNSPRCGLSRYRRALIGLADSHAVAVSSDEIRRVAVAHSAPELRRKPYLSTFGFRKEGVCSGYQLRDEDGSLVINVLTLISKRVEEGRSVDLSELMERILSDV